MNLEQIIVFSVLTGCLLLFIWGRWRYDVVAVAAMVILVLFDIVPASQALLGFGHPAVITVAAVLIISRALQNSGMVSWVVSKLMVSEMGPSLQVALLTCIVALCSAFMNNVGALALMLPVAIMTAHKQQKSPSIILMPIAFGSILGGLATLFGTPPNVIIAAYRAEVTGQAFSIFDFAPVGVVVAVVGILFISLVGWRLIPKECQSSTSNEHLFAINEYIIEARIKEKSPLIDQMLGFVEAFQAQDIVPVGLVAGKQTVAKPSRWRELKRGDVLLLKADPANLQPLLQELGLELLPDTVPGWEELQSDGVQLTEVLVTPESALVGRDVRYLRRRTARQINLVALARQGQNIVRRIRTIQFRAGDLLLLQGETEVLNEAINTLNMLPLAERDLQLGQANRIGLALLIFVFAIAMSVLGWISLPIAFISAIGLYILLDILPARDIYRNVDWPVIVLLGAMMSVGYAMEDTGATGLIANSIVSLTSGLPIGFVLALVMVISMTLSDLINNAATALVMAPISLGVANHLAVSPDPFLMAVAVGASCAFLTPIGHQSNTLVMGPGGYRFSDYWRMGLPLQLLILAVSLPMILWVWPL